jgi:hypothetical protein
VDSVNSTTRQERVEKTYLELVVAVWATFLAELGGGSYEGAEEARSEFLVAAHRLLSVRRKL